VGLAMVFAVCGGARAASPGALDRAAILGMLCGGATVGNGIQAIFAAIPGEAKADLAWSQGVVKAFSAHQLACFGSGQAALALPSGAVDAVTLAPASVPDDAGKPLPSLRDRMRLRQVSAGLALFADPDPRARLASVQELSQHNAGVPEGLLPQALAQEHDQEVATALRAAVAEAGLHSPDIDQRLKAIAALGQDARAHTEAELAGLRADAGYAADPRVAAALDRAIGHVHLWVTVGNGLSLLYNGVSAGSVLFLSALGLAIIFGLMGVINLAQGELIMIGAYVTFCVQQVVKMVAPGLIAWYPLLAIPVVIVVTGLVGVIIEATVIRHLYRRPLMTLLATWAISLLLVNLVRVTFGTQNVMFITPSYLTGGVRVVGDFLVTWNHLFAIGLAVLAFVGTLGLLRLTNLGLFIRAVTQNRTMAGCIGVSTRRIDMLAFGFGAGLAGLAGLALSPIYNVNPSMGTDFIVDSFMVVVLGGVGSLFGTAIAALGIGLVNVAIEPFWGAVAAKVISLVLIILVIQRRPEGLIPVKGRR